MGGNVIQQVAIVAKGVSHHQVVIIGHPNLLDGQLFRSIGGYQNFTQSERDALAKRIR